MILKVTIPIQQQGDIDVEVQTIITSSVISAYQLDDDEYNTCRWNLNPKFLTCFNSCDDFLKITLYRKKTGIFWLEVEFEEYDQDNKGNKIPGTEFVSCEMLEVSAVREVQDFPSIEQ